MARRKKQIRLDNLKVEAVAAEGKSLARHDGQVVFVKGAVPGDVVDVNITKKRKAFMEGTPIQFHQYSDLRVDAVCDYFGTCGGCKWQHMGYHSQLEFKQQQVQDSLERIAKVELPAVAQIVGSEKTLRYRNKLEFTFSNRKWLTKEQIETEADINRNGLGFHIPGLFDKVVDVDTCHLMEEPTNAVKNAVRAYALDYGLTFFDIREQHGLLRNLMIRMTDHGDVMVLLQFFEPDMEVIEGLMSHLQEKFPEITSLLYVINQKKNDTIFDQEIVVFAGKDHIIETMGDLQFKIGAKSFYQTNSAQAKVLYDHTLDFAGLSQDDLVYDLYTGTGTIANYCANQAKKVIGIEYVEDAIKDAFVNSEVNGITNTDFFAGDMKDVLNDAFVAKHGAPDVIITDPPRAGMHENVVDMILRLSPKKVVYVSCNPATQARDIALMDGQYQVTKIQPVDMFPHTHHVENIVLLELRG
ncbi:23S rRNA (uracil(1939)-C(5))-methyltransferase RlmD [Reichenbachiella agariperforans]|uniref:23S rRNA (uracil(1939)-C(5))-methyltransferase RlmD n=1 Tax=Reichenbachiella agariperforans TaxID=156994 RepID=UPI001C099F5C|nr:23S rRNA (uracil(1939)-C(5))-methyltransferase RlmD [Reichenbachiella agariperforans]MBU2913959.1 23S rRNA (uracil(1939)-C(5))-methyltransferase RlmD [Reichenbachiella agariperforans]